MRENTSSYKLYKEFEKLVIRILKKNNFEIKDYTSETDQGFDILLELNGINGIAEIKMQRKKIASLDLVKRACQRLIFSFSENKNQVPVLIISSYVQQSFKQETLKNFGILIWDIKDLFHLAIDFADEYYELQEVLYKVFSESIDDFSLIDNNFKEKTIGSFLSHSFTSRKTKIIDLKGSELCRKINGVRPGKEQSRKFELKSIEILKYLFESELELWEDQNETEDTLHKFDLLCRVRPSSKNFWQELLDDFNSRYVVFEFKNYTSQISQGQIYSTEKYLYKTALRSVSFIIARNDANKNAYKAASGALKEHGKLIIILTLNDLCEMLDMKDDGNDPAEILRNKIDEILIKMTR